MPIEYLCDGIEPEMVLGDGLPVQLHLVAKLLPIAMTLRQMDYRETRDNTQLPAVVVSDAYDMADYMIAEYNRRYRKPKHA